MPDSIFDSQSHSMGGTSCLNIRMRYRIFFCRILAPITKTVSVILGEEAIEVECFTSYMGKVVDTQGGTEADVKARVGKARVTFLQLQNIWKCNVLSLKKTGS